MHRNKIEIPTYYSISEIITDALKSFEKSLIEIINKNMDKEAMLLFDKLCEIDINNINSQNENINRYKITLLKKINQSAKPSKIKENIRDFKILKELIYCIIK